MPECGGLSHSTMLSLCNLAGKEVHGFGAFTDIVDPALALNGAVIVISGGDDKSPA